MSQSSRYQKSKLDLTHNANYEPENRPPSRSPSKQSKLRRSLPNQWRKSFTSAENMRLFHSSTYRAFYKAEETLVKVRRALASLEMDPSAIECSGRQNRSSHANKIINKLVWSPRTRSRLTQKDHSTIISQRQLKNVRFPPINGQDKNIASKVQRTESDPWPLNPNWNTKPMLKPTECKPTIRPTVTRTPAPYNDSFIPTLRDKPLLKCHPEGKPMNCRAPATICSLESKGRREGFLAIKKMELKCRLPPYPSNTSGLAVTSQRVESPNRDHDCKAGSSVSSSPTDHLSTSTADLNTSSFSCVSPTNSDSAHTEKSKDVSPVMDSALRPVSSASSRSGTGEPSLSDKNQPPCLFKCGTSFISADVRSNSAGRRTSPAGKRPSTGGERPGTGGVRPGTGGVRPGTGGERPGTPELSPQVTYIARNPLHYSHIPISSSKTKVAKKVRSQHDKLHSAKRSSSTATQQSKADMQIPTTASKTIYETSSTRGSFRSRNARMILPPEYEHAIYPIPQSNSHFVWPVEVKTIGRCSVEETKGIFKNRRHGDLDSLLHRSIAKSITSGYAASTFGMSRKCGVPFPLQKLQNKTSKDFWKIILEQDSTSEEEAGDKAPKVPYYLCRSRAFKKPNQGHGNLLQFKAGPTSGLVGDVLTERGWQRTTFTNETDDWNIFWSEFEHVKEMFKKHKFTEDQRVPHFENHFEISLKNMLIKNLKRYQILLKKNRPKQVAEQFNFFPLTFELPQEYCMFMQHANDMSNAWWILKPSGGTQGRGICIFQRPEDLKSNNKDFRYLCGGKAKTQPSRYFQQESFVVQRYIDDPYILFKRKFDFRIFVMVESYNPLKIWVYREGFCRFTAVEYDVNSPDPYGHVTNTAVQRRRPAESGKGFKRPISEIRQMLTAIHGHRDVDILMHKIVAVIVNSLMSVRAIITQVKNCFGLYGFDILVDKNLKPWLLEVNSGPSLTATDPRDRELKQNMLDDCFNILDLEHRFNISKKCRRVGGFDLVWNSGPIPCILSTDVIRNCTHDTFFVPPTCLGTTNDDRRQQLGWLLRKAEIKAERAKGKR